MRIEPDFGMEDFDAETMVQSALQFLRFAHLDSSLYTGQVVMNITDSAAGKSMSKLVSVSSEGVTVEDNCVDVQPSCTASMPTDIFFGIFAGYIDPMMAFATGQIRVDDLIAFADFTRAFELSPAKVAEFRALVERQYVADLARPVEVIVIDSPVPASAARSPDAGSAAEVPCAVRLSEREKLVAGLARGGLAVVNGLRSLSRQIDASIVKIKANETYQALSAKIREASTSNPALSFVMDAISTEIRVQRIDRTIARHKQSATDLARAVVSRLLQATHGQHRTGQAPTVSSMVRKQQLQRRLAELQAKNKLAEAERRERLSHV